MGGPGLIEALGHLVYEGEEGSGGGAIASESVLVGRDGKSVEFWKQKAFQNFGSGAEEGNWAVVGAKVGWFAGLNEGEDYG